MITAGPPTALEVRDVWIGQVAERSVPWSMVAGTVGVAERALGVASDALLTGFMPGSEVRGHACRSRLPGRR
jgi:hypothetical protein